ncbi:centrosomal protein kizuna [Brachionichthys hirsutus]|uniref:centrosomal protein kizuna n=1 Tax=Brachionichthys hirsutus TaxID=412623 RepID=UPI00360529DD
MARNGDQYYEKIKTLQHSMHEREKRRLELEKELFAYSRSDERISQITCYKLRRYLKEICDREARAKMRNLELLRDVECLEIGMKEYFPDHGTQQKVNAFKKISRFIEERKKMELDPVKADTMHSQHQDSYHSLPAEDVPLPPVGIFMGRQVSPGCDAEAGATSVLSHQPLRHSPNRSVHSLEHLPSGLLKDFRAGGGDDAGNRAHLSDDISASNDFPGCSNLSDKHEGTMATHPSVCTLIGTVGCVPFRSDDGHKVSPLVTLAGPEKSLSPSNASLIQAKNIPVENTNTRQDVHRPCQVEAGDGGPHHPMPRSTFGEEAPDTPGRLEGVSAPCSDVQLSESSASDLSISLTQSEQSEPEEDPDDDAALGRRADRKQHSPDSLHSDASKHAPRLNGDSPSPAVTLDSLSQEGLFYLLNNIEGRLHCQPSRLYEASSFDGRQLNKIIRLCNAGAGLNDEDLEACAAVILQELQRLSLSTSTGCLLPQGLVAAHQSAFDPNQISASLPPDAARLWDRWFKHALLLKEHRVLSAERLAQLFTPLLLERHATYSHQAEVLLRTLVSRSGEECPSAEDETELSSSCGPPSLLASGDVKPARPVQEQHIQELQSSEEDSQDESPVESVPIRESKAYQLLKQSAMQQRLPTSEEEDSDDEGLLGIKHGHGEDQGRAKCSSHQDPYPRKENPSSAHSGLQSKAFWRESDETNSDIEAALRPQPFNKNNDDTDDFWD